jgi:hypothetical protein
MLALAMKFPRFVSDPAGAVSGAKNRRLHFCRRHRLRALLKRYPVRFLRMKTEPFCFPISRSILGRRPPCVKQAGAGTAGDHPVSPPQPREAHPLPARSPLVCGEMTVATLGQLRSSGYPDRSVKEELRANLLAGLGSGRARWPSIVGYEDSVIPTLERALLAGHDVIMLGERGQAKSRLIRHLTELLDEEVPAVDGCELNDHPYRPICARCRNLVGEAGPETPVRCFAPPAFHS